MTRADVKSFFGSAEGVRARQFPDFVYRVASCVPVEFSAEPEFSWCFSRPPIGSYANRLRACERVDFVVEIEEEEYACKSVIRVFLLPNKYTSAKERKLISKFYADTWQMPEIRELANWASAQAFRSHDTR
jgi:hypothetical protein